MQDGTTAHGSRAVREFLQGVFTERIIALHRTIEWPPRLPNLTVDTLWIFLVATPQKQSVLYSSRKHRKVERILNEVNLLIANRIIVRKIIAGMQRKLQLWVEKNGRHVEGNYHLYGLLTWRYSCHRKTAFGITDAFPMLTRLVLHLATWPF